MTIRRPLNIFISYARADKHFYDELVKRLLPLNRERDMSISSDSAIEAGTEWEQEIIGHIKQSGLILLLISPDFMASQWCYIELEQAMECHRTGKVRVIPIILRPTDTTNTPFRSLNTLPKNGKPLASQNIDEAFHAIMQELRDFINEV